VVGAGLAPCLSVKVAGWVSVLVLLTSLGCDFDRECPCPARYQCCEGLGYCVAEGDVCGSPPLRPPMAQPDGGSLPPPQIDAAVDLDNRDRYTCCEQACAPEPVPCGGWEFAGWPGAIEDFQNAIAGNWRGFRYVPWTEEYEVYLELGADGSYQSQCVETACTSSFYWGLDGAGSFAIAGLGVDGAVLGSVTLSFTQPGQGGSPGTTQVADAQFHLSADRTRLRIDIDKSWGQGANAPARIHLVRAP